MFRTRFARVWIVHALFMLLIAAVWIASGSNDSALATAQEPKDAKINELLKERLDVLKGLVQATKAAYVTGKATFDELAQASARLTTAELELCRTDKERLAVLETAVAMANDFEKIAEQQYKAGQATHASVLNAKANRLEAQIALERGKVKMSAKPK